MISIKAKSLVERVKTRLFFYITYRRRVIVNYIISIYVYFLFERFCFELDRASLTPLYKRRLALPISYPSRLLASHRYSITDYYKRTDTYLSYNQDWESHYAFA